MANITNSEALLTLALRKIFFLCVIIVWKLTFFLEAISLVVIPSAMSLTISISAAVREAFSCGYFLPFAFFKQYFHDFTAIKLLTLQGKINSSHYF